MPHPTPKIPRYLVTSSTFGEQFWPDALPVRHGEMTAKKWLDSIEKQKKESI